MSCSLESETQSRLPELPVSFFADMDGLLEVLLGQLELKIQIRDLAAKKHWAEEFHAKKKAS